MKTKQPPKENKTGAARHARLGPSGYKSREICPSYEHDRESSRAADEGEMLHGIMEKHHIKALKSTEFTQLQDERQITMLEMVVGYITPIIKDAGLVEYEVELDLTPLGLPDTDLGTADVVAVNKGGVSMHVIDYKFGWLEVDDAEENIQGFIYALGAFHRHPRVLSCTVHFLQPRREELSSHTFCRDDMPAMLLRAQTINARIHKLKGKEFNPVVENCLWCAGKADCEALRDFILNLKGKVKLTFPSPDHFSSTALSDGKKAAAMYLFADLLGRWCWEIKQRVLAAAEQGVEIPGYDIKSKKGSTKMIDAYEAVELAKTMGLKLETLDDFLKIAEPSLHGIENALAALQPRGMKDKTKQEFRQILGGRGLLEVGRGSSWLESTK